MNEKANPPRSAVDLHSIGAQDFDSGYRKDHRFQDRYGIWLEIIGAHSDADYSALDLGCGSGELLLPLARNNRLVLGIDGSAEMLGICERKIAQAGLSNVTLRRADLAALGELGLGRFDLVVASSVLEYMQDLDATFEDITDLLTPGGTFIFTLPNGASLYRLLEPLIYRLTSRPTYYPFVVTVLRPGLIRERLKRHGFQVLDTRTLSPTPVLSVLLRPIGLGRISDNLVLFVCRKPGHA